MVPKQLRRTDTLLAGLGLLALLLALSTTLRAGENVLLNGAVEEATQGQPHEPRFWTADAWGTVEAEFDYIKDGESGWGLRVEVTSVDGGDAKWISDYVEIGDAYALLVGDSYRGDGESSLLVQAIGKEGESLWLSASVVGPADQWGEARGLVQLPEWTTTVRLAHSVLQVGWLETDSYFIQPITKAEEGPLLLGPKVSIAFDDGWVSSLFIGAPILEEYGYRASFYICTDWVDKPGFQGDYMTSKQLKTLAKQGHEIGSHSRIHSNLTEMSFDEKRSQVEDSFEALASLGHFAAGFAPPLGAFDGEISALVEGRYDYLRTVKNGVNQQPYKAYDLRTVVVTRQMKASDVRAWVDLSASEGSWLILLYHRFTVDEMQDGQTFQSPEQFRTVLDILVERDAIVLPIGEMLGVWVPESYEGFGDPTYTVKGFEQPEVGSSGCSATPNSAGKEAWLLVLVLLSLITVFRSARRQQNNQA
jgi:peptidoglycan/xylan/chitin deacetylase (PgdA/CDA1 family)